MSGKLKVLDLFSGIGGFSLGLERTDGFETVAFCEINQKRWPILRRHWPDVPIYPDVRRLPNDFVVDLVTAGFPCQDISLAGKGAGLSGSRSRLFWRVIRTACLVGRPSLLLENVAALLGRGMGTVLGALASVGYDAEWHCIPLAALGAPHIRDRIWILADADRKRELQSEGCEQDKRGRPSNGCAHVSHSNSARLPVFNGTGDSGSPSTGILSRHQLKRVRSTTGTEQWGAEPGMGRVAHGIPNRVDRIEGLGNAVGPHIPELWGHAILEARRN